MSINYKKIGNSGEVLLLLHGWQHSSFNLQDLGKILSKDFQVIIPDLPGFGESILPSEDWNTDNFCDELIKLVNELKIKPTLIGHSFGGRLSVKLAANYPDLFSNNLILIGTPGFPQRKNIQQFLRIKSLKILSSFIKIIDKLFNKKYFQNYFIPRFASNDYKNSGNLKNLLVKTINENLSSFAQKITKNTLLLWGENDSQASTEQAYLYNKSIINSKVRILKYHGHEPFNDVGSHLCAKIIREFLK